MKTFIGKPGEPQSTTIEDGHIDLSVRQLVRKDAKQCVCQSLRDSFIVTATPVSEPSSNPTKESFL